MVIYPTIRHPTNRIKLRGVVSVLFSLIGHSQPRALWDWW